MISAANTPVSAQLDANPRVQELNFKIVGQREERRQAEQDLVQLDADTSVKNSKIKNTEVELNTLAATVKQLRAQKGEAFKRLADLDDRIVRLEAQCEELAQRLKAEEDRVSSVKTEIETADANREAEEQLSETLRAQLQQLDSKYADQQSELSHERTEMERIVDELTNMERSVDTNKDEVNRLENQIADLEIQLKTAEALESPSGDEAVLFKRFQQLGLNGAFAPLATTASATSTAHHMPSHAFSHLWNDQQFSANRPLYDAIATDAFKSDPFADVDHSMQPGFADPFSAGTAPGGGGDPFGAPAAKPNAQTSATAFANFANFAQFAS